MKHQQCQNQGDCDIFAMTLWATRKSKHPVTPTYTYLLVLRLHVPFLLPDTIQLYIKIWSVRSEMTDSRLCLRNNCGKTLNTKSSAMLLPRVMELVFPVLSKLMQFLHDNVYDICL